MFLLCFAMFREALDLLVQHTGWKTKAAQIGARQLAIVAYGAARQHCMGEKHSKNIAKHRKNIAKHSKNIATHSKNIAKHSKNMAKHSKP